MLPIWDPPCPHLKVGILSVRKRTNSCSVRFVSFFSETWFDVHTVPFLESGPVATGGSFPAGICELRWAPASKAGSIHVVNSGEVPEQTGKTLLCVPVGRRGPHAAR